MNNTEQSLERRHQGFPLPMNLFFVFPDEQTAPQDKFLTENVNIFQNKRIENADYLSRNCCIDR